MTISDIDWFEWNGVKCTVSQYGMHVLSQPSIVSPLERSEQVNIPGKSGTLTMTEGVDIYDNIALSCSCVIDDINKIPAITGWLKGNGKVKFPIRPNGYYKARIANQISFEKAVQGNPHRLFSIQFQCEPFFYLDSGDVAQTYNSTPITMINDGNISSLPLITARGSGSAARIICGSSTLFIDFAGDGDPISSLTIDCEAKVAYTGDGSAANPYILRGTRVTGEWFYLPYGLNGRSFLSFAEGITSLTVTPRWRAI